MADYNMQDIAPLTMVAVSAITANRFVKLESTTDRGVVPSAAGTDLLTCGVAVEAQPTAGNAVAVQNFGIAKVTAGAAITRGAQVTSDASGRAVTVATGNTAFGVCLNTIAAAGEVAEILLTALPNSSGPTTP